MAGYISRQQRICYLQNWNAGGHVFVHFAPKNLKRFYFLILNAEQGFRMFDLLGWKDVFWEGMQHFSDFSQVKENC